MAGISDRRHGKDHLGALWALCGHRYADLCKFNGVIEADCRLPSAKTDFVQSASGRDGGYSARSSGFVWFPGIFVCCFSFSGSVGMAWGLGAWVLHRVAVVCASACAFGYEMEKGNRIMLKSYNKLWYISA